MPPTLPLPPWPSSRLSRVRIFPRRLGTALRFGGRYWGIEGACEGLCGDEFLFAQQFRPQFILIGKDMFIFGGEEMLIAVKNGVTDDGVILEGGLGTGQFWRFAALSAGGDFIRQVWPLNTPGPLWWSNRKGHFAR